MRKFLVVLLLAMTVLAIAGPVDASDANFVAHLSARDEVPTNESLATGQAIFHLNADGTELDFTLFVANIENVVAAHIHLGPAGVNGPVVAFLFGPAAAGGGRSDGVLAHATITEADLVGPLAGQPFSALVDAMLAGNAYVNAHTNDGIAPTGTGPGDLPAGEIRGQIH
jgi:CHRD domain